MNKRPWVSRFDEDLSHEYPSLLLASKEIRAEAQPVYAAYARFRFRSQVAVYPPSDKAVCEDLDKAMHTAHHLEITHDNFHQEEEFIESFHLCLPGLPTLRRLILEVPGPYTFGSYRIVLDDSAILHLAIFAKHRRRLFEPIVQAARKLDQSLEIWVHARVCSGLEDLHVRIELNLDNLAYSQITRKQYVRKYQGPEHPCNHGRKPANGPCQCPPELMDLPKLPAFHANGVARLLNYKEPNLIAAFNSDGGVRRPYRTHPDRIDDSDVDSDDEDFSDSDGLSLYPKDRDHGW